MIRGKRPPVVHVIAFKKTPDAEITIKVTPDVLDMTQYAKGEQVLRWKLDTVGFHFPNDTPAIEFTSPGWEKSFGKVEVGCDQRTATVVNKNRDGLAFAYTVRVVEKSSGRLAELDPQVQNNMP